MKLQGKKIAILATDGFEQSELELPMQTLQKEGAIAEIVSLKAGKIRGWKNGNWADEFAVTKTLDQVQAADYDALLLPGGVINPDKLRKEKKAVDFVKGFFSGNQQKPVGAICHGPWTLINAGVVKGRKMTSYDSVKVDLLNAGADWVDEEVVVDHGLVTSRDPQDLPAFNRKIVEEFAEGIHH